MTARARSGRRPGPTGTREAILEVARRQFAELGYDRTSLRGIAQQAGVDPTLVSHFYGSKQQLFVQVAELPFEPAVVLPGLLGGEEQATGARLARFIVDLLESDEGRRRVTGLVRAAASEPEAARLVRERVTRELLVPIAEQVGGDRPELRASLLASQIVGLVMARLIVAVEPLASAAPAELAGALGPVLQHYLTGRLDQRVGEGGGTIEH